MELASVRVEVAVDCDVKRTRDTRATTLINKLPLFGIFRLVDHGTKIRRSTKSFSPSQRKGNLAKETRVKSTGSHSNCCFAVTSNGGFSLSFFARSSLGMRPTPASPRLTLIREFFLFRDAILDEDGEAVARYQESGRL